jgi:ABC-type transport system involved in multi-copper enzyme maturation permease subunit
VSSPALLSPVTTPIRRQPYPTLVRVELRKMTDTRSGKALLAAAVGLAVILLGWKLTHTSSVEVSFASYNSAVAPSVAFLLPLIGLLAMTSEWSQRTALTTFTMSPKRLRVFSAKLVASLLLAGVAVVAMLGVTFLATLLGGVISGDGASFDNVGGELRISVIATLLQVVRGAATGAIVPLTGVAVGVYFVAPTAWAAFAPSVLHGASRWFDIFETYDRLYSSSPGRQLAQTMTSILVWVAIPAAVGLYRSTHREVK